MKKKLAFCGGLWYYNDAVERDGKKQVGVDYGEGPPVPIPNTEVKLVRADNTWLATAREDRCSPTLKAATQKSSCFFFSCGTYVLCRTWSIPLFPTSFPQIPFNFLKSLDLALGIAYT